MSVVHCQKCGTRMVFARTPKGAAMPIDIRRLSPEEVRTRDGGRRGVFVVSRNDAGDPICRSATEEDLDDPKAKLFLSHFGNCPAAKEFSRKAKH